MFPPLSVAVDIGIFSLLPFRSENERPQGLSLSPQPSPFSIESSLNTLLLHIWKSWRVLEMRKGRKDGLCVLIMADFWLQFGIRSVQPMVFMMTLGLIPSCVRH